VIATAELQRDSARCGFEITFSVPDIGSDFSITVFISDKDAIAFKYFDDMFNAIYNKRKVGTNE
jgi:hypothetical protein